MEMFGNGLSFPPALWREREREREIKLESSHSLHIITRKNTRKNGKVGRGRRRQENKRENTRERKLIAIYVSVFKKFMDKCNLKN